jgi:hypothetical protein
MSWDRFWRWYDRGARVDFGGKLLEFIFDWKGWLATIFGGGGGGIVTFLWAAIEGRSPLDVWLMGLVATAAGIALIYFAISIIERRKRSRPTKHRIIFSELPEVEIKAKAEPDIDAREVFFKILENSEWRKEQEKTTLDTSHLVRNWLQVRLDTEIHKALRNSLLDAWGEECLAGTQTTPEKPIPPDTWDKVEIVFDRLNLPRTSAHFKGATKREVGRMAWVGVKFSKQQVFQLFPLYGALTLDRIPVLEFLKIATESGWNFESLHLMDMQEAIRQGGLDETLIVWGRLNRYPRSEMLMRQEPLDKIPAEHWREFRIQMGFDSDNFNVKTWRPKKIEVEIGYVDLHVDRGQASAWLVRDAAAFRGKTKSSSI